jgi:hypothetical protein
MQYYCNNDVYRQYVIIINNLQPIPLGNHAAWGARAKPHEIGLLDNLAQAFPAVSVTLDLSHLQDGRRGLSERSGRVCR